MSNQQLKYKIQKNKNEFIFNNHKHANKPQ